MREAFPGGMPEVAALANLLRDLNRQVSRHGNFNYLLSNGDLLLAHCADRLSYIVRKAPFTTAHLLDEDVEVDFSQVTTPDDRVAVIATAPLTDNEPWEALVSGELAAFQDGKRVDID
jgi:glutamine amidotransferase